MLKRSHCQEVLEMNSHVLKSEWRIATNDDIPLIHARLSHGDPVWYCDLSYRYLGKVDDVARGPFSVSQEEGHAVLHGIDKTFGAPASLRIRESEIEGQAIPIVEIRDYMRPVWESAMMGGMCLCLPR